MEKRKGTRSPALSTPVIRVRAKRKNQPKGPRRSEQGGRKKTNRGCLGNQRSVARKEADGVNVR